MTYNPSRRLFLGGSLAASAAGATGLITPAGLAAAQPMKSPKIMYGPTPGVAKLNRCMCWSPGLPPYLVG